MTAAALGRALRTMMVMSGGVGCRSTELAFPFAVLLLLAAGQLEQQQKQQQQKEHKRRQWQQQYCAARVRRCSNLGSDPGELFTAFFHAPQSLYLILNSSL